MAKITVTISPNGQKISVRVEGVPGAACHDLTRALEETLGKVSRSEATVEYYLNTGASSDVQIDSA